MYIHIYICIHINKYDIFISTYIYIIYVYICMFIHTCWMYIYIYICIWWKYIYIYIFYTCGEYIYIRQSESANCFAVHTYSTAYIHGCGHHCHWVEERQVVKCVWSNLIFPQKFWIRMFWGHCVFLWRPLLLRKTRHWKTAFLNKLCPTPTFVFMQLEWTYWKLC